MRPMLPTSRRAPSRLPSAPSAPLALIATCLLAQACSDPQPIAPVSLDGPRAMDVARGEVCMRTRTVGSLPGDPTMVACTQGERGAIGLIVNELTDRVAIVDMGSERPSLVNTDPAIPGITHLATSPRPTDVAASPDGTVAYVTSAVSGTLDILNLWLPETQPEPLALPGAPVAVATTPQGQVWVALNPASDQEGPARLWSHPGMRCTADDCAPRAGDAPGELELGGRVADMALAPSGEKAFIAYADQSFVSVVALGPEALSAAGSCLGPGAQAPCEIARIALTPPERALGGFTSISVDPHGLLAYVVDRPNSQVFVLDARRHTLIDARTASEPETLATSEQSGINVLRQPLSLAADISRAVSWTDPADPGHAIVTYSLGAWVGVDNGALYYAEALRLQCEVRETGALATSENFYGGPAALSAFAERHCLEVPDYAARPPRPRSSVFEAQAQADPARLAHRRLREEPVRLVANPAFAMRDALDAAGRLSGATGCQLPQGSGPLGCNDPRLVQPLAPTALERLLEATTTQGLGRADLLAFEQLVLSAGPDNQVREDIRTQPHDARLRDETWTLTYEAILHQTPRNDGLLAVSPEQGSTGERVLGVGFVAAGLDLCALGVRPGDRVEIFSTPLDTPACAPFARPEGEALELVVDTVRGSTELLLAAPPTAQGQQALPLPTRACFPQGLRYAIRAHEQWVASAERSGLYAPTRQVQGACVARTPEPGEPLDARVATGEVFTGAYLRLAMAQGPQAQAPTRDQRYSFAVARNYTPERLTTGATLPTQVGLFRALAQGHALVVVDPGKNLVWVRSFKGPASSETLLQ